MDRRAQGISVNVIIIAAIALVVMVILVALVFNTGGDISNQIDSCSALGAEGVDWMCQPPGAACGDGWATHPTRGCAESTEDFIYTCCVSLS